VSRIIRHLHFKCRQHTVRRVSISYHFYGEELPDADTDILRHNNQCPGASDIYRDILHHRMAQ
jgi:hypothetical protein